MQSKIEHREIKLFSGDGCLKFRVGSGMNATKFHSLSGEGVTERCKKGSTGFLLIEDEKASLFRASCPLRGWPDKECRRGKHSQYNSQALTKFLAEHH